MTESDVLKGIIAEQTEQIYNLYKRIEELNEILKERDRKQQQNIQECNS